MPANSMPKTRMLSDVQNKHILDTSAWNALFDDPDRKLLIEAALSRTIFPTCISITEVAATEDTARRMNILRLMKTLGRDNRPMASPNQLIIMACEGYSKRAAMITLNAGSDAEGAWITLNDPTQVDEAAQRLALDFNEERENVMRALTEGLRRELQSIFVAGTQRPRSIGSLIRQYSRDDNFLYEVINPIYERATGGALPRTELRLLLNSLYEWRMFLMGYACAIYQRAVQEQGYGHNRNPGHLDLWSATYLPICDVFVTRDKRQRRALKVLNKANPRPSRILSYAQWRQSLLAAPLSP
ncbi:MAG TPA: hypothetical protein VMH80_03240 [Bryobacteraceae bacterium]|nr:hypothetical protein [Bryobacteraceae bacterium]